MNKNGLLGLLGVVTIVAAFATGCSTDRVGTCQNDCAQGKTDGCITDSTDCVALCASAQTDYDNAREDAVTAGCAAQFDTLASCSDAAPVCDTGACGTEGSALTSCFVEFCTANPTSPACT